MAKAEHVEDGAQSVENYFFKVVGHGQKERILKIRMQTSIA